MSDEIFAFDNGAFDPVCVERKGDLFEFSSSGLSTTHLKINSLMFDRGREVGVIEYKGHFSGFSHLFIDCSFKEFERFKEWVGVGLRVMG